MIDQSLVFILRETKDGRKMAGDIADTLLSVVLLDHLLSYKEYAATIHRSGIRGSLCIGGLLTPILGAVENNSNGRYLFKFNHSELGPSLLLLPCENRTSVKTRRNINIMPSPSALNIDIGGAPEDEPEYSPADYEQHEYFTQADYEEQIEFEQHIDQPEHGTSEQEQAHYEEGADQGGYEIAEIHKKLVVLEKLRNLHSKTMKDFKKKMRTMKKSLKSMDAQLKDFQSKQGHRLPPPK
ncbi:hypothetical protein AXX17_ATUG02510 (mitochondrion) [Arabidopsis thaliana]|uniref:Arabidopsis retrotransposon Orf1 C-terminal domain-containing protein n=1 Tax=Arabidopsis thaliana TaxID=3702 RepID=A0A178U612_ARATH|nr:hypothetical protein AXX17_ATUG02510 [Arabidopsis thaliana]